MVEAQLQGPGPVGPQDADAACGQQQLPGAQALDGDEAAPEASPPPASGGGRPQRAWHEVAGFALPMLATLAADPLASLVDTAFVGHLGPAALAGTGLAISIFSSITRLFNAPLLAVTTSAVAAAAAAAARPAAVAAPPGEQPQAAPAAAGAAGAPGPGGGSRGRRAAAGAPGEEPLLPRQSGGGGGGRRSGQAQGPLAAAVSSALALALAFSAVQVVALAAGARGLVGLWGAPPGTALYRPALDFLTLRGVAAPITVLLLVMQGAFRGLKDATTPLYATLAVNALNIALEPPFVFAPLHMGVRGSALATAIAQAVPVAALLSLLSRRGLLRLAGLDWAALGRMFGPTVFLLLRTVSISAVFAVATSCVSRAGSLAAAAHQVAFQVWMASSLLADALAVSCQTILARAAAAGDLRYGRRVVRASVGMALGLGMLLSLALAAAAHSLPALFVRDRAVRHMARKLMPVVAATQPLNALAFVLDGVLYGAGGFKYAAFVMVLCAAPSLGLMLAGQALDPPAAPLQAAGAAPWPAGGGLAPLLPRLGSSQAYSQPAELHPGGWRQLEAAASGDWPEVVASSSYPPLPRSVWLVWAGLVALMVMRALTILVPYLCRCYPFSGLFADIREQRERQGVLGRRRQAEAEAGPPAPRLRSLSAVLLARPRALWAWLGRGSFLVAGVGVRRGGGDEATRPLLAGWDGGDGADGGRDLAAAARGDQARGGSKGGAAPKGGAAGDLRAALADVAGGGRLDVGVDVADGHHIVVVCDAGAGSSSSGSGSSPDSSRPSSVTSSVGSNAPLGSSSEEEE